MPPDKKLYASGEDYLEAILLLHKKMGMVRSVDVARHMEVSKPSVCHAVATLRDGGFLTMDEDYFLHLTDAGREVAEQIYEKHRFFTEMLTNAGVDPITAERDACRIEHVISESSFQRLKKTLTKRSNQRKCSSCLFYQRGCTFLLCKKLQLKGKIEIWSEFSQICQLS